MPNLAYRYQSWQRITHHRQPQRRKPPPRKRRQLKRQRRHLPPATPEPPPAAPPPHTPSKSAPRTSCPFHTAAPAPPATPPDPTPLPSEKSTPPPAPPPPRNPPCLTLLPIPLTIKPQPRPQPKRRPRQQRRRHIRPLRTVSPHPPSLNCVPASQSNPFPIKSRISSRCRPQRQHRHRRRQRTRRQLPLPPPPLHSAPSTRHPAPLPPRSTPVTIDHSKHSPFHHTTKTHPANRKIPPLVFSPPSSHRNDPHRRPLTSAPAPAPSHVPPDLPPLHHLSGPPGSHPRTLARP